MRANIKLKPMKRMRNFIIKKENLRMKKENKYDNLSIQELEAVVFMKAKLSRESLKEMYEVLEYLRMSNRYKENPGYKKSSFWTYLDDMFKIREGTYRKSVKAYIKFPNYCDEYGHGTITKISQLCGSGNVDYVIGEIKKAQAKHKKPLQREYIETIINLHRSRPKIERVISDWKSMYEVEKAAHATTLELLRESMKTIEKLNAQIAKLKGTAVAFGNMKKILNSHKQAQI